MVICHDCQKDLGGSYFARRGVKLCYECYKIWRGDKERCYVCDNIIDFPKNKYKFDTYICEDCSKNFDGTNTICDGCLQFITSKNVSYYYDGEHELCNNCWEEEYARQRCD